ARVSRLVDAGVPRWGAVRLPVRARGRREAVALVGHFGEPGDAEAPEVRVLAVALLGAGGAAEAGVAGAAARGGEGAEAMVGPPAVEGRGRGPAEDAGLRAHGDARGEEDALAGARGGRRDGIAGGAGGVARARGADADGGPRVAMAVVAFPVP